MKTCFGSHPLNKDSVLALVIAPRLRTTPRVRKCGGNLRAPTFNDKSTCAVKHEEQVLFEDHIRVLFPQPRPTCVFSVMRLEIYPGRADEVCDCGGNYMDSECEATTSKLSCQVPDPEAAIPSPYPRWEEMLSATDRESATSALPASSAPPPAGSRLRRLTDEDASPIASAYKLPKKLSCKRKKAQDHVVATVHVIDWDFFSFSSVRSCLLNLVLSLY